MLLFSRVGIAKEVLTDQGSWFMSRVMRELLSLLQVKQLRTSVYHPQTDGLVERFNKTLEEGHGRRPPETVKWGMDLPEAAPLVLAARHDIPVVPVGDDLSPAQKQDLDEIILQHQDVFSKIPGEPLLHGVV